MRNPNKHGHHWCHQQYPFRPLVPGVGPEAPRTLSSLVLQHFAVFYTPSVVVTVLRMELNDMIALGADVELQFSNGTLMANSTALSLLSSVLRGAVEANTGRISANSSDIPNSSSSSRPHKQRKKDNSIPLEGFTKEEWLQVAAFWYPVVPAPTIESWQQAELLLRVGSQFDLQLVLHKVDLYLRDHAKELTEAEAIAGGGGITVAVANTGIEAPESVWKWLRLADRSGLTVCLAALADRAAGVDWQACSKDENLEGLSPAAMRQLVKAMVPKRHSSLVRVRRFAAAPAGH